MERIDPRLHDLGFGHLCCVSGVSIAIVLTIVALLV